MQSPHRLNKRSVTPRRQSRGEGADRIASKKSDWLQAGLLRFAEGGERNLQAERIARDLGVTKGSYYYYFRSREDFIEQMLTYSFQATTRSYIEKATTAGGPMAQLRSLIASVLTERKGKDFDFYLRNFARRNKHAARLALKIDHQRVSYVCRLLIGCGISEENSTVKAEIFYNYYLGWYVRNRNSRMTRQTLAEQFRVLSELLGLELGGP